MATRPISTIFLKLTVGFLTVAAIAYPGRLSAQPALLEQLRALPGTEVFESDAQAPLQRDFEILVAQPFDHNHPEAGGFVQRVFLSHVNPRRPMVVVTEGYQIDGPSRYELTGILDANQLRIEHRFNGGSTPDSIPWQYLTVEQAAADHHHIINMFRKLYPGKWVSTGISKGGQTALFHRYFYPEDVHATVAYVSPMPTSLEDPRLNDFIASRGTPDCREKIRNFQRAVLHNREGLRPLIRQWATEQHERFPLGVDSTLEYAVLEYPFSFWQSTAGECDRIPPAQSSPEILFEELSRVVPLSLYSENGIAGYRASFYQFFTQLGYYGFATDHLGDLLEKLPHPDNAVFAPPEALGKYDSTLVLNVLDWLQTRGDNILYIYGGQDSWSGAAVELIPGQTNALKMVCEGGWHATRIHSFPPSGQFRIYDALQEWLDMPVGPRRDPFAWAMVAVVSLFLLSMLVGILWLIVRKRPDRG
ncbi:MAG TPA: S28 family serine protease [Calditrichia bacterium]|nr:S28 family serine protease [Calditrichia bacterium]